MKHNEYIRVSDNANVAVLMVHGIAGTPAHFRDLIPMIPEEWSVYNLLLDGHGKEVRDFGASSMKKWKTQVEQRFMEISATHEKIIVVTHSMGGLFAIRLAVAYPEKIARLFLQVLPLKVFIRPRMVISSVKVMLGLTKSGLARMMVEDSSIRLTGRFWEYVPWLFRMLELLWEIRRTRRLIPQLSVPCETYQSAKDELVSMKSCRYLEGHPYIHNTVMEHSGHFGYEGEDREKMVRAFERMIKEMK